MKPIEIRVIKAEKKGRKINITIESDLYSDEVFAVTPFYDEGDKKNQLQALHFNISVNEIGGKVKTKVEFGRNLGHYTKGHSQLHYPLNKFYLSKKDCVMDWVNTEKTKWFTEERIKQILKLWEHDERFHSELKNMIQKRKTQIQENKILKAKNELANAALEYSRLTNQDMPF